MATLTEEPATSDALFVERRATAVLAGIGGDSHSVGLSILQYVLRKSGYEVVYLGIQNSIADVVRASVGCDAVLISCMDGHALTYLKGLKQLQRGRNDCPVWYIGGNPVINPRPEDAQTLCDLGFDRAFMKFVDAKTVVRLLDEDLAGRSSTVTLPSVVPPAPRDDGIVSDVVVTLNRFNDMRDEVLGRWPTGRAAADLSENAAILKDRPLLFDAMRRTVATGGLLIQPRVGVALPSEQEVLFDAFAKAGADVCSYQVDSFTRNGDYRSAANAIRESSLAGRSMMNGFPVINHGVKVLRAIASRIDRPIQCRHSARQPELLAEISVAGGVSAFEGGAISYNIPYYKYYKLSDSIKNWQYVDRLCGQYFEEYSIIIDREYFGVLTGTLIPPSLAIATGILESLLAARQGVQSVSIGYAEQGNRPQDIAAIRSIVPLAEKLLRRQGYGHVRVFSTFHQYMAAFPPSEALASEIIRCSSTTARLAGATRILTKTTVEASSIPSMQDNLKSLALTALGVADAQTVIIDEDAISSEMKWIEAEVEVLVGETIALGAGDVAAGIVKAFALGYLDIPFSPSIYNKGLTMTARDSSGAVRFLECGKLPFNDSIRNFHAEHMRDRLSVADPASVVAADVLRIPQGEFEYWPLSERPAGRENLAGRP